MTCHISKRHFSPALITLVLLSLCLGVSLYFRIVLPYPKIFVGDWVKLAGPDAYFHMRTVDNLVHNFPHLGSFNPYLIYPGGGGVSPTAFFDYLVASLIWLIGLGSPTQHTVDVVSVFFPAILGTLTVIPVYFIGKELLGRWAGLVAAGLIAISPGEFLDRSILGNVDHHVAEVLFATTASLFVILALKHARQRKLTISGIWHRDWEVITKPLGYCLLAGIFLGIYFLTWEGALFFLFVFFVYFVAQFIADHLRHTSTEYLGLVGIVVFSVVLLISLSVSQGTITKLALVIALLVLLALGTLSRLMSRYRLKSRYFPLFTVAFGLIGLGILWLCNPSIFKLMAAQFEIFWPKGTSLTVTEATPILYPLGSFTFSFAWEYFTTGLFLSLIGLGVLIYHACKSGEADKAFLVVWSLIILAATLGQRRFAYYFAVNVSLLTGYLSGLFFEFVGVKKSAAKSIDVPLKNQRRKHPKEGFRISANPSKTAFITLVVFLVVLFPNVSKAAKVASGVYYSPTNAWCESLDWLKANTPDPFGDPDFYYELHDEPFLYPPSAYGVTAWWDYGYTIARVAHRLPTSNPGQGFAETVARMFIAQDEDSAIQIAEQLNSKYVIIDLDTTIIFYPAMVAWAGRSQDEFFDQYYYVNPDGNVTSGLLYHPEYYRSFAVRLYNFDGAEVTPQNSTVISYEERTNSKGERYKQITSWKSFPSYEEAQTYMLSQKSGIYRMIGSNPFASPVPLKALGQYQLVHSSQETTDTQLDDITIPQVKIFEYTKSSDAARLLP